MVSATRELPLFVLVSAILIGTVAASIEVQPLARLQIELTRVELDGNATISATPDLIGQKGERAEYVTLKFSRPSAQQTDWIGVFSPANFNSCTCAGFETNAPMLCTSPIKYSYANLSTSDYVAKGEGTLKLRLINQRADFAFALFGGDVTNPVLLAVSNPVKFANLKAPLYVRLAQGKSWNVMTVTWTSGYGMDEATPVVRFRQKDENAASIEQAVTLTFGQNDVCGPPARTFGWRDPGFIHTAYLTGLWSSTKYYYEVGHKLKNGSCIWDDEKFFTSSPFPGQDSLQRVIIFGDMGKAERDGSNEYENYQPGSLNTTDRLVEDLDNIDFVLHIGDIVYSNGYLSQWDQFTEQIEPISSRVAYMTGSGNHERDWPNSGSFYNTTDSGGECGVPAETYFNMPAENRANYWYSTDYGMFRFCVADTEHDWREGTEQYKFIENCFASADRQKQPWLIFLAHRVLGYSSGYYYGIEGMFAEPMGRVLENLWQKYKVDLAFYGHIHNYERTCPVYENICVSHETKHYSGSFNATIHIVVGGGGSHLSQFSSLNTTWSVFKDYDFGFSKLTAFNHSSLLVEYKKSSNGLVYDKFWITRNYRDILGCDKVGNCPAITIAQ